METRKMIKNSQIVCVDADPREYHQDQGERGTPEFIMSSSALRLFAQCPQRWKNNYNPPDSDAKDYGSLLDTLVLQPATFRHRYAVKPLTYKDEKSGETKPWNGNSLVCKAWLKDHEGFEIVSNDDVNEANAAKRGLDQDEVIKAFLDASERAVWLQAEWHDPKSGVVIPLKALIDLVPRIGTEFEKSIGDLKSTRNAALVPWTKWCYQAGYFLQSSFYLDLLQSAQADRDLQNFCFILSENYAPFQSGKRLLSHDFIELGRSAYRRLLEGYSACLKSGRWPGYDDHDEAAQGWSIVAPFPYMEGDTAFAPKFQFETDEPPSAEIEDYRH
jgi:hypothetical protein